MIPGAFVVVHLFACEDVSVRHVDILFTLVEQVFAFQMGRTRLKPFSRFIFGHLLIFIHDQLNFCYFHNFCS